MQSGQGARSYTVKQLCRWGFLFRILARSSITSTEKYGTLAYLIELTRTSIDPLHLKKTGATISAGGTTRATRATIRSGVGALRALCATTISRPPPRESTTSRSDERVLIDPPV
jgi:hypothetical protein